MDSIIEEVNKRLRECNLDFLKVLEVIGENKKTCQVVLQDTDYGSYRATLSAILHNKVPLHRDRKSNEKYLAAKKKLEGTKVNGYLIKEVHKGSDLGYTNRGYFVKVVLSCGHESIMAPSHLRYKTDRKCTVCSGIKHGERSRDENGVRKKRSKEYIYWVSHKKELPPTCSTYEEFYRVVGKMPDARCIIGFNEGIPYWNIIEDFVQDNETHLILTALRQAFRYSKLYLSCLEAARVETDTGVRYICAQCGGLFKKSEVQVDHIHPIMPIDGKFPEIHTLIDRVWTKDIQILDKICHNKKSTIENRQRRDSRTKNAFDSEGHLKFDFLKMSNFEYDKALQHSTKEKEKEKCKLDQTSASSTKRAVHRARSKRRR